MAIDYDKLMQLDIPAVEQTYDARDAMLYALGLGLGADPMDLDELGFVYEEGLAALPMMANVLGARGSWVRDMDTGVNYLKVVHGEQALTLHAPLPVAATVVGKTRVAEIVDKGEGRGALLVGEREITDKATGTLLATVRQTIFARDDGGFGGPTEASRRPAKMPERAPDLTIARTTRPEQALIYRLSGDYNPLHADPRVAEKAGFPRPILHGLCTFGIGGFAVMKGACGLDPAKLKRLDARFTSPVFPGETLETDLWIEGAEVFFRVRIPAREKVALDNGYAVVG